MGVKRFPGFRHGADLDGADDGVDSDGAAADGALGGTDLNGASDESVASLKAVADSAPDGAGAADVAAVGSGGAVRGTPSGVDGDGAPWRGVNLGNWLVLEKWMEPHLFEGLEADDENELAGVADPEWLEARIRHHRDNYITEKDFSQIAASGLNLVRLPVPYTVFSKKPPLGGGYRYVDKAMDWCEKYGLKLLIDLHTAPGGQNGFDSSGTIGAVTWHLKPQKVEQAIVVLEALARRYGERPGLFGIEVINEPISYTVFRNSRKQYAPRNPKDAAISTYVPLRFLRQYYKACYVRLRKVLPEDKAIVFHDGFRFGHWKTFFAREHMTNVYVDAHVYLSAIERTIGIHSPWAYRLALLFERHRIRDMERHVPVLVGEWCVENEWAKEMDRGDLTDDDFDAVQEARFRTVTRMQLHCFNEASGWVYWSWKLEPSPQTAPDAFWKECWDFRRAQMHGWLPRTF